MNEFNDILSTKLLCSIQCGLSDTFFILVAWFIVVSMALMIPFVFSCPVQCSLDGLSVTFLYFSCPVVLFG